MRVLNCFMTFCIFAESERTEDFLESGVL